jgi:predicted nucleotidyltransferase
VNKADFNVLCEQVAVSAEHLRLLLEEIERYIPNSTVWAFGSRVDGTHRTASDLDLAIHCDKGIAMNELPKLNERLVESDLPFKVQLLDFDRLPEHMQENIKRKYVVLYQSQEEISGK